jgi:outer membrane protein assembly factor BamD (BamD/ComL family)
MQAVRSRAFTRAQQTLDTYARRFPDGQLAPESRLVQIRLYLANQQPEAARAAARAFLKRHPNSGLRRTIERLLK